MITLRGMYKNGRVSITDDVPFEKGKMCGVLVTFLDAGQEFVVLPNNVYRKLVRDKLLTDQELKVLNLAQQGKSTKEIAEIIDLGDGAVRNYLSSIYEKLKAVNRIDAINKAKALGILE